MCGLLNVILISDIVLGIVIEISQFIVHIELDLAVIQIQNCILEKTRWELENDAYFKQDIAERALSPG
jgi:hypothetical protein